MPSFPKITQISTSEYITDTFKGYNHNLKIADGEWYDMTNLTGDYAPLMAERAKRGTVATLANPHGMIGKAKLAYIDGTALYYDNVNRTSYLTAAGVTLTSSEKQLVSMGAYICIFPDKVYFNTENFSDCGYMEASYTSSGSISYAMCTADGAGILATVSATAPTNPANGDYWIDTSGETHVLKQWSSSSAMWSSVATSYVKLTAAGIGNTFNEGDGVTIAGCSAAGTAIAEQIAALNGSKLIKAKDTNYIVVIGLIDQAYEQTSGTVTAGRTVPGMDFVTEAQNRLWGCKYGLVNGKTVNEIYACALGDFKNWNQFNGISTDSYAASVGTDGEWTGAITLSGYPLFFKEGYMHKVYVSSSGAHQIVDMACRGVQKGCRKSLAIVNEMLFYKAREGICCYDGSQPMSISEELGGTRYSSAAAGGIDNKYYISMKDGSNNWSMFAFDTAKNLWHKEDATEAVFFAKLNDELYCIDSAGRLLALLGTAGTLEGGVTWEAVTGTINYMSSRGKSADSKQKYIGRLNLRMKLPTGSSADMWIMYDSDGEWQHCGHMDGSGLRTFLLPIRPRRCDHFQLKLSGTGEIRLFSIGKVIETGSDEP